jgi:hypothetical protein
MAILPTLATGARANAGGKAKLEAGVENPPLAAALGKDEREGEDENGNVMRILKAVRRHDNNSRGEFL